MNVRKLVLPVVVLTMVATIPADAAQRRGGGGGGGARAGGGGGGGAARAARTGPSQGRAVPRAAAPVRGPYGGGAAYRNGYYRPGYNRSGYYGSGYYRPGYYRPYYPGYYRPYYYRPYYSFYPRFSVGFGIWAGFPIGYASFYYGSPYPYAYPYSYPYPYPYPAPSGYGYPIASAPPSPYPNSGPAYASSTPENPRSGVTATATGGVTFEITPGTAEVFVDGNFVGVVDDFAPTARPLTLSPGRHRIEVRAPGYETIVLDSEVPAAQVIPYRGTMRELRVQ